MSTRALHTRLRKLIGDRLDPEHCPGGITVLLRYGSGEPEPVVPADAHRCERCGQPHVLILEEVIVTSGDEARQALEGAKEP
jgi:hypothetical protein